MSAVIEAKSFQNRVFEKIRTDIGSLMTDDELKKIVEISIERIFFTGKKVPGTYYGDRDKMEPPEIYAVVKTAVESRINAHVQSYVLANSNKIDEVLKKYIDEGFLTVAVKTFDGLMATHLQAFQNSLWNLMQQLREKGINVQ